MRSVSELEELISSVNPDAINSIYETLEKHASGDLTQIQAYQEILEGIVYDILKTPKK